jgi:hypothetical protein
MQTAKKRFEQKNTKNKCERNCEFLSGDDLAYCAGHGFIFKQPA